MNIWTNLEPSVYEQKTKELNEKNYESEILLRVYSFYFRDGLVKIRDGLISDDKEATTKHIEDLMKLMVPLKLTLEQFEDSIKRLEMQEIYEAAVAIYKDESEQGS